MGSIAQTKITVKILIILSIFVIVKINKTIFDKISYLFLIFVLLPRWRFFKLIAIQ